MKHLGERPCCIKATAPVAPQASEAANRETSHLLDRVPSAPRAWAPSSITPFPDPFQTQKKENHLPGSLLLAHRTPCVRANTPTALTRPLLLLPLPSGCGTIRGSRVVKAHLHALYHHLQIWVLALSHKLQFHRSQVCSRP